MHSGPGLDLQDAGTARREGAMPSERRRSVHVRGAGSPGGAPNSRQKELRMAEETETNQIKWTLHDTNPELVEPVRNSLSEVVDPEIGMNIIQLGLVRDVSLENDI